MLDNEFASTRWAITELRAWQWNPAAYNVADPFALLTTLEYAPLEERLRTFLERLENVPAYYAAAKANIANPTREHTQLAIEQNRGALAVFGAELEAQIAGSKLSAAERSVFKQRLAAARAAIEDYVAWLEALDGKLASGEVQARSFRLGRELYAKKFAFDIQSGDTAEALYERALAEKETLLARMALLVRPAVAEVLPERGAARRPARQDRPGDREAVGAARRAREPRRRGEGADTGPRALGERARSRHARPDEAAHGPRDAGAPARHRGREHRGAGPLRPRRADLLQRDAARRPLARARRELAARVQRLDAADPEHPRGGARPLRAADLREQVAELDQEHLRQRRDDRRLGRVHRADDARIGLRRLEGRGVADLLEVESAHRLQHDPRLRRARARDERGGRHEPAHARGVPNRAGGRRQVEARDAHERAAHELLLGLRRDPRSARAAASARRAPNSISSASTSSS